MTKPYPAVRSDSGIMGGTPVFARTRVPFQTLLDYLEAGGPLSAFLEDFPPSAARRRLRHSNKPRTRCSPVRIQLDECLPKRLKHDLAGHNTRTVPETGWASKRNGELLGLAEVDFDVFLTVDRNVSFQQDVGQFTLAVVVLVAKSNRHADLQPLVPDLLAALPAVVARQVVRVGV
jgi:hypothetical protein